MFYWVLIKPMWEHTEHKSSIFKPFSEAYPGPLQTSIVVDVEQVNVSQTEASPGTLQTSKMESFAIIHIICIDSYHCKALHFRCLQGSWRRLCPANVYLFKVNNRTTRKRCEIYFKVNNKNTRTTSDVAMVFLLLTLNIFYTFMQCLCC